MINTQENPVQANELQVSETISDSDIIQWMNMVEGIDNSKGNRTTGSVLHYIKGLVPVEEHFELSRNYVVEEGIHTLQGMANIGYSDEEVQQAWSLMKIVGIRKEDLQQISLTDNLHKILD